MDAFPFQDDEWNRVKAAAHAVLEACLANETVVADSRFVVLQESLHALRSQYGEHPVLMETEADFCGDAAQANVLYRRALKIAVAHSLPTASICLSLARNLIEAKQLDEARRILELCREEISAGHESDSQAVDTQEYAELMRATGG